MSEEKNEVALFSLTIVLALCSKVLEDALQTKDMTLVPGAILIGDLVTNMLDALSQSPVFDAELDESEFDDVDLEELDFDDVDLEELDFDLGLEDIDIGLEDIGHRTESVNLAWLS